MKSINEYVKTIKKVGKEDVIRGNKVWRSFSSTERYLIDFAEDFHKEGWMQYDTDQDACFFGVWVNPVRLQTLTYVEGDWSVVECQDKNAYNREIDSMNKFYGEGRIALVIDDESATEFRQDRSLFYARETS